MRTVKTYAPIVLRLGIALVFLWFGTQQLLHATSWTSYLPTFTTSWSIKATTIVMLNGLFETIFGALLLLGVFVRSVALVLALHMFGILISVGYNEIGVRDFGLLIATIAIALNGKDEWSLKEK